MRSAAAERRTLVVAGALYAVIVVILRWNHIGDVAHEIALADRLLHGQPLYHDVVPGQGSLWPPFASLALVPFALVARLNMQVATALWSVVGVAALVLTVMLARRWGWKPALLALLCVAMPVQTNFEHHNVNTVLLALIVAGAVDLTDGRDRRAGVWLGLAAALKAFPALLLVYLAFRRRWIALASGVAVAAIATALPLVPYGPGGAVTAIREWLAVGLDQGQWQLAISDQSVRALATRLGADPMLAVSLSFVPIVLLGVIALRRSTSDLAGIGAAALAAVLAVPLAWVHYYVLAYPGWLSQWSTVRAGGPPPPAEGGDPAGKAALRLATTTRWIAAIATSGLLTMGQGPLRRALLGASVYTWGGLLLLVLLATMQPPARETG